MIILPGTIINYPDYVFNDGSTSNKLFVAINQGSETNDYLLCLTTSQIWKRLKAKLCYSENGYYYFPVGTFNKETWILFSKMEYRFFTHIELVNLLSNKLINLPKGLRLQESEYYSLLDCILKSDDLATKIKKQIQETKY